MEKEALIQGFKERLGDNASVVSDRSYDEIANVALPSFADDSKITEDTWNLPVQMLNTLVGQYRHDVANGITNAKTQWATENDTANKKAIEDGIAAFKAQWEKDHLASKQELPVQTDEEKHKAEMTELVKNILAENNKQLLSDEGVIGKLSKSVTGFMEAYNRQQRSAQLEDIKNQITNYLTDLGATSEPAVRLAVKQLEIGENPDIDTLKLTAKKNYETINTEFFGDGAKPYRGQTGAGSAGGGIAARYIKEQGERLQKEAQDAEALRKTFK